MTYRTPRRLLGTGSVVQVFFRPKNDNRRSSKIMIYSVTIVIVIGSETDALDNMERGKKQNTKDF